jgi:hypothetical protein
VNSKTNGYVLHGLLAGLALGFTIGSIAYHLWMTRGGLSGLRAAIARCS